MTSPVGMLVVAVILLALGVLGHRNLDALTPAIADPEQRRHRRRVLRRGVVGFQVFGVLLLVTATFALTR